jgi:hypothetical protein
MSATLQIALLALVPMCMLFAGSAILFLRGKTVASFLQLVGAGCLAVLVLAHICEALSPVSLDATGGPSGFPRP